MARRRVGIAATAVGAVVVLVLAIAMRLPLSLIDLFADGRVYANAALSLQHTGAIDLQPGGDCAALTSPEPATCRLPAYSVLLALVTPGAQHLEDFRTGPRVLNLVADLVTAWCVWHLLGRFELAMVWRLLAALLVLLHPTLLRFSFTGLTESIATALFCVCVALCATPSPRRLVGGALLLGLGGLLRTDLLLLVPVVLIAWWAAPRRDARVLAAVVVAIALPLVAWTARNFARTGVWLSPAPSACDLCGRRITNDGVRAWLGTWIEREEEAPLAWSLTVGQPPPDVAAFPPQAFSSRNERDAIAALFAERNRDGLTPHVNDAFARLAHARWREHPFTTLAAQGKRAAYLVLTRSSSIFGDAPSIGSRHKRWWPWLAGGCFVVGVLGLVRGQKRATPQRTVAIVCLIAIVSRLGGITWAAGIEQRYANEVWPLVIVGLFLLALRWRKSDGVGA